MLAVWDTEGSIWWLLFAGLYELQRGFDWSRLFCNEINPTIPGRQVCGALINQGFSIKHQIYFRHQKVIGRLLRRRYRIVKKFRRDGVLRAIEIEGVIEAWQVELALAWLHDPLYVICD